MRSTTTWTPDDIARSPSRTAPHSMRALLVAGLTVGVLAACDTGQTLGPSNEPATLELLDFALPTAEEIAASEAMGLALAAPAVLFDRGPSTGTVGSCVGNYAPQNWADRFNLPEGGIVEEVSIFTCVSPRSASVHLKLGDAATGPFFYEQDSGVESWRAVEGGYEVRVKLVEPFEAPAGEDFWIGVHGNNVRLGQLTLMGVDDGKMSQFSYGAFVHTSSSGDQMFRLYGTGPTPPDVTAPTITAVVSGDLGSGGWYTSDVAVTWIVVDDESEISASSGCGAYSVTEDTHGQTFTCEATSDGGTRSESVTIQRDATRPDVGFRGNRGSYTVDEAVSISCSAADETSGIASSSCPEASGEAYTFMIGENLLRAGATDHAANEASASSVFEVHVTVAGVCNLTRRWVTRNGIARSLCKQLENGLYSGYQNLLRAQVGKTVTADHAGILMELMSTLQDERM